MQLSSSVAHTGKQVRCLLKYTRVPSKKDGPKGGESDGVMTVVNLIYIKHESN